MLDVAEAIIRVFHRLGDYKHKQRNRMKFLIKQLGLGRVARGVRAGARRVPARGRRARCRSIPTTPPVEQAPDWARPRRPSVAERGARAAAAPSCAAPASSPRVAPRSPC